MAQRYVYVLNEGKATSTISDTLTFDNKGTMFPDTAFSSCSVNPTIKATGVVDEYSGVSANFFEIRNGPYDGLISCDSSSGIVNRKYPDDTSLVSYGKNLQQTKSYKIRTYKNGSGVKIVGNSGLSPTVNLETYDWFVLINPEITGNDGAISNRPHFAKIKQIVSYDEYGDGFKFEPKYPNSISKNTKYELYRGPSVNNTDVVAVSYGLRGDTANSAEALSDKYDISSRVSIPTWYFYEDRLDGKKQLNYNSKYTLTTCRWFSDYTVNGGTGVSTATAYGSTLTITQPEPVSPIWVIGQSLFRNDTKEHIGNVASVSGDTITLDYIRNDMPMQLPPNQHLGNAISLSKGRTIHQTVFRTENEYGTIINDMGPMNQHASFIDNIYINDSTKTDIDLTSNTNYTYNPSIWKDSCRNYKRSINDYNSTHGSYTSSGDLNTIHANLTGAKRYLYYTDSKLINNIVFPVMDARLNNPLNKISQMATVKALDYSGIKHLKLKENSSFTIRNSIYSGTLGEYSLPFTVTSETIGSTYNIILNQITEDFDYRNGSFLSTGDIIRIDKYYYVISSTNNPSSQSQKLTVNYKKKLNDKTFVTMSSIESFTGAIAYVRSWNGGLSGSIPIDTEVVYSSVTDNPPNAFTRLTINGNTISKSNASLYNNNLVMLESDFMGNIIPIDYGDSINKHIKLKEPNRKLYVPSNNISFLYYATGKFTIDEEVFSGLVEDIESNNEQGLLTYTISGRDTMSRLLTNTVNKNLNYTNDIIYSSLPPMFDDTTNLTVNADAASAKVYVSGNTTGALLYDLLLTSDNKLIGEVKTVGDGITPDGVVEIDGIVTTGSSNNDTNRTNVAPINVGGSGTGLTVNLTYFNDGGGVDLADVTVNNPGSGYADNDLLEVTGSNRNGFTTVRFNVNGVGVSNSNNTTLTLADNIYQSVTTGTTIKIFKIRSNVPYLCSTKAISSNIKATSYPTDLSGAGNKGVVFIDGLSTSYANNGIQTHTDLAYTSATGTYQKDKSLGYDITDIKGISEGNDSSFAFKLSQEHQASITYNSIITPSFINYFSVVNINTKSGSNSILSLAPTFPVVLGSIETNSLDEQLDNNSYLYLINTNIPSGGFIHSLRNTNTTYFGPNQTFRYCNLQKITPGNIKQKYDSIYNNITYPQKISGACSAYNIISNGNTTTAGSLIETKTILPKEGSNLLNSNYTKYTIFSAKIPLQYDDSNSAKNINSNLLENIDYRCKKYELLSIGDLFPDSKLRHNNLGNTSLNLTTFGLMLESDSQSGNLISHENYYGNSIEPLYSDNSFELHNISSSNTTSNLIKRWGIIRLIEATFDWHFNPVDVENIESLPQIIYNKYVRFLPTSAVGATVVYTTGGSLQFAASVTLKVGDLIYSDTTNNLVAKILITPSNPQQNWAETTEAIIYDDEFTGAVYKISRDTNSLIDCVKPFTMYSSKYLGLHSLGENNLDFMSCYLMSPNIDRNYFSYSNLNVGVPHNVMIPLISEVSTNGTDEKISAFHDSKNDWDDGSPEIGNWLHTSRVVAGLSKSTTDDFYNNSPHIYDNCTLLFTDMKSAMDNLTITPTELSLTSSPIELNTITPADKYQPAKNLMINLTGTAFALVGTQTENILYSDKENYTTPHIHTTHTGVLSGEHQTGELYRANMFLKPKFNMTGKSGKTIEFLLDNTSTHGWLSFMPDLTGYYIVSDLLKLNTLPTKASGTQTDSGVPKFIAKITSHSISYSTESTHTIILDTAIDTTANGVYYRLMRISETTFDKTPAYFKINEMFDTGLQYNTISYSLTSGKEDYNNLESQEGIYSMYLLLDIDNSNAFIERRNIDTTLFDNNETIETYITDGTNTQTKELTVTYDATLSYLKFEYDGELTGNGVVSFGKTFTIETPTKINIDAKKAYIGTTFSVGTDVEVAIEEMLEENDIVIDTSERHITYTTNIIKTTTSTTITLNGTSIGLDTLSNNVIYNQDGKLIGKITNISGDENEVLTIPDMFYTPLANDELVLYARKPFIINTKFNDDDVFNSIKFLAAKNSLEYIFEKDKVKIQKMDNYSSRRKYSLRYKDGKNLLSVDSNKSLFDKANKVIVIGDNIRAVAEMPTTKTPRILKYIDINIKHLKEASIKAQQLLELHNTPTKKITLTMDKTGFELMKAGDLITLNFPNHNIPADDYIVFEIENVMSSLAKITVGTFNKTIAERLAEINITQDKGFTNLFTKDLSQSISNKFIIDDVDVEEISLKYQLTTLTGGTIFGFV